MCEAWEFSFEAKCNGKPLESVKQGVIASHHLNLIYNYDKYLRGTTGRIR